MNVICLEDPALHALIDEVVKRINKQEPYRWVSGEKAMEMLGITSKATLQKYRDEDRVRFSHPDKKIIIYDYYSILEFLDAHANKP